MILRDICVRQNITDSSDEEEDGNSKQGSNTPFRVEKGLIIQQKKLPDQTMRIALLLFRFSCLMITFRNLASLQLGNGQQIGHGISQ